MKHIMYKLFSFMLAFVLGMSSFPVYAGENVPTPGITSGYYDDSGIWVEGNLVQDLPTGIEQVNKTAEKRGDNEYEITLNVQTEVSVDKADKSAVTLVLDTSGSMEDDDRMANVKKLVKHLIDEYAGSDTAAGRYLSIIDFDNYARPVTKGWSDVSTKAGYDDSQKALGYLKANGTTNLDAGIQKANEMMDEKVVEGIPSAMKHVVILADGAPTKYVGEECRKVICGQTHQELYGRRYHVRGDGSRGSKVCNDSAASSASALRSKISNVYTVCYGAKHQHTYFGGPTVGDFLANSIATKGNAFDANNTAELEEVFDKISQSIITGTTGKGLVVTDKTAPHTSVDLQPGIPMTDEGFTWKLANPTVTEKDGKKIYTYELKYTVRLNADDKDLEEGKYYPLNGETFLQFGDQKIKFPIPAAQGVKTRCNIVYNDGVEGVELFPDQTHEGLLLGEATPEFHGQPMREGHVFTGWTPALSATVKGDQVYKATWAEDLNGNNIPDVDEHMYTIVYKDGVGGAVFADEVHTSLVNMPMPQYTGSLQRPNYIFAGWAPVDPFGLRVTGDSVFTAKWDEDFNGNGVPDQMERYNITYTDGVEAEEVFPDRVFEDVLYGTPTPAFDGEANRLGYIFAGWDEDPNVPVTGNKVYTAQWLEDTNGNGTDDAVEKRFTVQYMDGVNNKAFAPQKTTGLKEHDLTPVFVGQPTYKDYLFEGWTPDVAISVEKVNAPQNGDVITYTAIWAEDFNHNGIPDREDEKFYVAYHDGVGGTVFADKKFENILVGTVTPQYDGELKRAGFVFDHWEPTIAPVVNANADYTAVWEVDVNNNGIPDKNEMKHTVIYTDGLDHMVAFEDRVYEGLLVGTPTPAFGEAPTAPGHIFLRWEPAVSELVTDAPTITYTAVWALDENGNGIPDETEEKYSVVYKDDLNGALFPDQVTEGLKQGDLTPGFEGSLEREGFVFTGWDHDVTPAVTGNAVYTATWAEDNNGNGTPDKDEEKFTVTYKDGADGTVFADQTYTDLLSGTKTPGFNGSLHRDNYVFNGWDPVPSKTVTGTAVYTAQWKEDMNNNGTPDEKEPHYTIRYTDGVEGEEIFKDEVYKNILKNMPTPKFRGKTEREGYVFVGWDSAFPNPDKVTEDKTYTAVWAEDNNGNGTPDKDEEKFTVTYKDGADGTVFADQTYTDLLSGTKTPGFNGSLHRDNYVFNGWDPVPSKTVTGTAVYTAQWKEDMNNNGTPDEKEPHYTIRYTDGVEGEEIFKDEVYKNILKNMPTPKFRGKTEREGYVFVGWDSAFPNPDKVTEDKTYTAVWAEDNNGNGTPDKDEEKFTVTYKDGADGTVFADQTYTDLLSGTKTPGFNGSLHRDNYVFNGWDPVPSKTVTGTAVYTAQWKEDMNNNGTPDEKEPHYTIRYTDGVEGEEIFKDEVYKNILKNMPTPKFRGKTEREGYVFVGWDSAFPNPDKVTEDKTYTAVWAEDNNGNGTPDKDEEKFTVTYKDGAEGTVFADQTTEGLMLNDLTPVFAGETKRDGYVFTGWTPEVSISVKGSAVYTATWAVDANGNGIPDNEEKPTDKPTKPTSKPNKPSDNNKNDKPATGVNDHLPLYGGMLGVAAVLAVLLKKKENEE